MPLYKQPGSDRWWIRLTVGGQKIRKSTHTSNREQAEEFEQRERTRLWQLLKLGDGSSHLWAEVAERWLNETTKRSKERDERIIEWLNDYLEDEPISVIDRKRIEDLRRYAREDGSSLATVDRMMALLRAILRKCEFDWAFAGYHAPKVPMYHPKPSEPRWLRPHEYEQLERELPPHLRLSARFAVLTGLRMTSMLRLTWSNIDIENRRAWIPGKNMKAGHTHGLPLSVAAVDVLKEIRNSQAMQEADHLRHCERLNRQPTLGDTGHVFTYRRKPVKDCNGATFKRAVERAGIAPFRWHDLRHTWASWAIQGGVTLHELQQLGGWSSYQMVLRYAHLAPDHLADAAEKVAQRGQNKGIARLAGVAK